MKMLYETDTKFVHLAWQGEEKLLRQLRANVYLSVRPEKACPAKWVEGAKTLKPSAEMLGEASEALKQSR